MFDPRQVWNRWQLENDLQFWVCLNLKIRSTPKSLKHSHWNIWFSLELLLLLVCFSSSVRTFKGEKGILNRQHRICTNVPWKDHCKQTVRHQQTMTRMKFDLLMLRLAETFWGRMRARGWRMWNGDVMIHMTWTIVPKTKSEIFFFGVGSHLLLSKNCLEIMFRVVL